MALTRAELDQMVCGTPDCDHSAHDGPLVFHSQCHPEAPTWAEYDRGILTITCAECEALLCQVEVALVSLQAAN
jgi:hypothetical protein